MHAGYTENLILIRPKGQGREK